AIEQQDYQGIAAALAAGESPTAVDDVTDAHALGAAVEAGDERSVKMLLDAGADPNVPYMLGTALDSAAAKGYFNVVALLLAAGAKVETPDEDGSTALGSAAACGHIEIVRQLMAAGASVRHKDRYGQRPIIYAAEKGHAQVVDLLAKGS